ncbi:MAG: demethoxyubiquinone hydroxylase family protein [Pseudomonadota bacterium]
MNAAHTIPPYDTFALGAAERAELRSDHAGEAGAVSIYEGVLRMAIDPEVRRFAQEHLRTERAHLKFFDDWLPPDAHSRLLPLWRLSGWLLGALPALLGPRWVYATIDAVETFVVAHYQAQLDHFPTTTPAQRQLRAQLEQFQADEGAHRDDAARRAEQPSGLLRAWQRVVGAGSAAAVAAAKRI